MSLFDKINPLKVRILSQPWRSSDGNYYYFSIINRNSESNQLILINENLYNKIKKEISTKKISPYKQDLELKLNSDNSISCCFLEQQEFIMDYFTKIHTKYDTQKLLELSKVSDKLHQEYLIDLSIYN